MDFHEPQKAGSRMGTGTMIVLDDQSCPVGMLKNLEHFFAQESCGWCTPCWSGLSWAERILGALEDGQGEPADVEQLAVLCKLCAPGNTFCALAPGAVVPLQSGLKYFAEDFARHPEAVALRAAVIEGLILNHPHDCPVCDEGGECHLQDMTVMTGHDYRRYRFNKRTFQNQKLGPMVQQEMNRCIQCYRCVRFFASTPAAAISTPMAAAIRSFSAGNKTACSKASLPETWPRCVPPESSPTRRSSGTTRGGGICRWHPPFVSIVGWDATSPRGSATAACVELSIATIAR